MLLIIFIVIFYGSFIEPQLIVKKVTEVDLAKTSEHEKIKIAFISDLHVGPYKQENYLERVVQIIKAEQPDLILLGGDYLFNKENEAQYLTPLKDLSTIAPVFAVIGNHEYNLGKYGDKGQIDLTKTLRQEFLDWNIKILNNEMVSIEINDQPLAISGINDLWTGKSDLLLVRDYLDPKKTNILLSHNPDIILDSSHSPFDLILSGHTHAGQIRLPYIGALMGVPTILGRDYDHGLFQFDQNFLYISAGLGESGPRARLFNPPEISIINLDL